nr:asparagine synthase-related protein [Planctomycetota bacterium]
LRGHIPEHVRTNPRKRGFPTPFARAARGVGRDWVLDLMHDVRFLQRGWWNVDACRALLDEERPVYDRALWAVCTWETWARLFLDGDAFDAHASETG